MPDALLSRRLAVAAALVLSPPDGAVVAILSRLGSLDLNLGKARQDFYDVLCVPQSGRYIPPYAHVLAKGRRIDDYHYFPPARYDGGDAFREWYDIAGFDPLSLPADPMNHGPHRPLDHVGYLLAFAAGLVETDGEIAGEFASQCMGDWIDSYIAMLARSESQYIVLVAGALAEAVAELREMLPREDRAQLAPAACATS